MSTKPKRGIANKPLGRNKERISFALPGKLKLEMNKQIASDGYSFRAKSIWICEAVNLLFERKEWIAEIFADFSMDYDANENVSLDTKTKAGMETGALVVNQTYPQIRKGSRSAIVRTAIMGRLSGLHETIFQLPENNT